MRETVDVLVQVGVPPGDPGPHHVVVEDRSPGREPVEVRVQRERHPPGLGGGVRHEQREHDQIGDPDRRPRSRAPGGPAPRAARGHAGSHRRARQQAVESAGEQRRRHDAPRSTSRSAYQTQNTAEDSMSTRVQLTPVRVTAQSTAVSATIRSAPSGPAVSSCGPLPLADVAGRRVHPERRLERPETGGVQQHHEEARRPGRSGEPDERAESARRLSAIPTTKRKP